ncbi:GFA family protein [Rhodovibrionaceae bacterium A322]
MSAKFTGGCLCGAVRYESSADPVVSAHCHCEDCRRSSGTGHCTHLVLPKDAFSVSGELKGYKKATDSGNMVERSFCPTCGAAVYSTNSGMPDLVFPRASSLDDLEVAAPAMVVYASRAASWDQPDPALPAFEEMPPSEANPL